MATNARVRKARYSDHAALAAALNDGPFFADRLRRQRNGLGMLFVAEVDGEVAGTIFLWLAKADEEPIRRRLPGVPLLTHLDVVPAYRRRGVGTELVSTLEDYLRKRGRRRLALAVQTDNDNAIRLYQKLGYQDWGFGPVKCDKDVELLGGENEPEECFVFVKWLKQAAKPVQQPELAMSAP